MAPRGPRIAHAATHTGTDMRSAVVILSMVAAIAAEAPYHLPRPAAHAPSFNYPTAPAPPPPPSHPHPRSHPQFIQYPPQPVIAPTPQYIQGPGYHYQQPNIAPTFVQPALQPHPQFHSHHPAPQPIPVIPQPQYAQPHPLISYPQQYAQPQPVAQPQTAPSPQPQPSLSYGQPQQHNSPAPIQPLPAYFAPHSQPQSQLQPQPHPAAVYQPISYYQPQAPSSQGYSYQQSQAQAVQHTWQLPLQAQPLTNNAASSTLSSYQADSNQYSSASAQSHSEALDSTVVDRVQNIIRDSEHTSARNAGYLSLVSGVSLEGARPSIEISSFLHNSPLATTAQSSEHSSVEQISSSQPSTAAAAVSAPSQDYGFPTITANIQTTQPDTSIAFLPQNKPATSYGAPQ